MTTLSGAQMAALRHICENSRKDDIDRTDGRSEDYCRGCRLLHARCMCPGLVIHLLAATLGTIDELAARAEAAEAELRELRRERGQ